MSPSVGDGTPDALDLLTAYQHSAVVAAASLTGIAETMYSGERDAAAIADRLDLNERAVRSLIGAMVALGLAEAADGGHVLTETGAPLARSHPETIYGVVGKEWFFYGVWNGLPEAMADGHARIAPWRKRLAGDPEQALGFLAALDDLASMFGGELPGLAGLEGIARLLDVGGGAGSHAERLAAAVDGLEVTVLDLPEVEPLAAERHPSVPFITGDLGQPRFGLPEDDGWDAVLLANILHDHDAERCVEILREARGLLKPGGTLLLYEWVLNDDRDSPAPVAMFDVMMMLENEGGAAWTEGALRGFLSDAGFSGFELNRGFGPIAVVRSTA